MGTAETSPFGSDGLLVPGTSPDGTTAITVLLFSEQNAVVELEFLSAPGDLNPVPADFVKSVGQLQFDALKAGLPDITHRPPQVPAHPRPSSSTSTANRSMSRARSWKMRNIDRSANGRIIVGLEPDASVVHGVGLGIVDGVVMSFTEGVPGNTATATKDGNTYNITGTASGVSEANPAEQITKPFDISVTCP